MTEAIPGFDYLSRTERTWKTIFYAFFLKKKTLLPIPELSTGLCQGISIVPEIYLPQHSF